MRITTVTTAIVGLMMRMNMIAYGYSIPKQCFIHRGSILSSSSSSISSNVGAKQFCHSRLMTRHFSSSSSQADAASTETSTLENAVVPLFKKERIILDPLPTLYVYDHCPFCVRVRMAFGLKNVKHNIYFLANDDKATPTALVGKKIAPIFVDENIVMPESLDIIRYMDSLERYGSNTLGLIQPASGRTDIAAWQSSVRDLLRGLQRPRYVATGLLPEFQQLDGRHAFIRNHEMPPYTKAEWKKDDADAIPLEQKLTIYAEAMAKDPAADIEELNRKLYELNDIIYSEHHCSNTNGVSYDDIDLFSRLRSITIIKDVEWPSKLRAYMDNMSELSDVPLYDEMAL